MSAPDPFETFARAILDAFLRPPAQDDYELAGPAR